MANSATGLDHKMMEVFSLVLMLNIEGASVDSHALAESVFFSSPRVDIPVLHLLPCIGVSRLKRCR